MKPKLGDRSLFQRVQAPLYFNCAAVGPLANPVVHAMHEAVLLQAERGVGAIPSCVDGVASCKASFGKLVGAEAADVAFVGSTSAGIIGIATTLDWRAGDRIVVFRGDFPANITPWQQAAQRHGLELVWLDGDAFRTDRAAALDRLRAELKRGVRLVALSAVSFRTGERRPVEAVASLCEEAGTELFVDGIQGVGITPLRMSCGIDYLAVGGHKWLGGPFGTGLLAVAPHRWKQLGGAQASWLSHEEAHGFLSGAPGLLRYDRPLQQGPALFEGGGFNGVGAVGLAAALEVLLELGVDAIFDHVDELNRHLVAGLTQRGLRTLWGRERSARGGAVVVELPGRDVGALVAQAAERGLSVSSPDGRLRLAPHWSLDRAAVDGALEVLDGLL